MQEQKTSTPPSKEIFHLLVVDDDKRLRSLLSRYLKDESFWVSTVESVPEAEHALKIFCFDLIILDVMMPEISGLTLLQHRPPQMPPVIVLTAQGDLEERIQGLALGADDYLVKPFDPRELSLRIQSILRRTQKHTTRISFGPLCFDPCQDILYKGDTLVGLTLSERKMLRFFLDHQEQTLSREQIASALGEAVSLRTVDVQINRLRQKIEPVPSQPRYLQSMRGQGYRLRSDG